MTAFARLCLMSAVLVAHAATAAGQGDVSADGGTEDSPLVRDGEERDDPLAIGGTIDLHRVPAEPASGKGDEHAAAETAPRRIIDPPVKRGKVLQAVSGVREIDHRVEVELIEGLAHVRVTATFANYGRHPAEVRYRLATPPEPSLASLRVCAEESCREGSPYDPEDARAAYDAALRSEGSGEGEPVAHAVPVRDGRGAAIALHAAPIAPDGRLTLEVGYLVGAPRRGGVVRMTLPARGSDPRAAPASVTAEANGLLSTTIDGAPGGRPASADPWRPAEIVAKAPTSRALDASAWRFPCGERTCARLRIAAGLDRGEPVDLMLLVDVSPSIVGPARNRMKAALASLLAAVPGGSRVRTVAFAAHAEPILDNPVSPAEVPLERLVEATARPLGAATRFEPAWDAIRDWIDGTGDLRPLVIIVGDGGITRGARGDAFRQAARANAPVNVLNIADRTTWSLLRKSANRTGGIVVDTGRDAKRAAKGRTSAPLEERIAAIFAPVVARDAVAAIASGRVRLGPLRAGEELLWEGAISRRGGWLRARGIRTRLRPAPEALARALGSRVARTTGAAAAHAFATFEEQDVKRAKNGSACRETRPRLEAGVGGTAAPIAVAGAALCATDEPPRTAEDAADGPTLGHGIPKHTVRRMMRQRAIPAARRCLRRDRAGRESYSVRAVFHLRLADREVTHSRVTGEIDDSLRRCLRDTTYTLDVPAFRGTVEVTYPVRTKAVPPDQPIELRPDVAEKVDAVIERTTGPPLSPGSR